MTAIGGKIARNDAERRYLEQRIQECDRRSAR
jgi:hypothetical protein